MSEIVIKRYSGISISFSDATRSITVTNDHSDVEVHADGLIVVKRGRVSLPGDIPAPTLGALTVGQTMPDGTIFAGYSVRDERMFTTPVDAFYAPVNWRIARQQAKSLYAHGHADWRLPDPTELLTLFNNRAAIGGLPPRADRVATGWYWSGRTRAGAAVCRNLANSDLGEMPKHHFARVRLVRP